MSVQLANKVLHAYEAINMPLCAESLPSGMGSFGETAISQQDGDTCICREKNV